MEGTEHRGDEKEGLEIGQEEKWGWSCVSCELEDRRGCLPLDRDVDTSAILPTLSQDLGNTNFSFHVPRATFARRTHAELIARALNGPDVGLRTTPADGSIAPASGSTLGHGSPEGVYVNDRNDLCVKVAAKDTPSEFRIWSERKISGSAFKILSHRAYHHGTMLLSSDLSLLGSSLRSSAKSQGIVSKGVDSVRSKVTNLSDAYPSAAKEGLLTHDSFVKAVVREFWRTYSHAGREGGPVTSAVGAGQEEADAVPLAIEVDEKYALAQESKRVKLEEELGAWDWIFGQCPEFEVDISTDRASTTIKDSLFDDAALDQAQVWLRVKNGVIQDVEIKSFTGDESCKERLQGLKGTRYDDWTDRPPLPVGAEVREEEQGSRRKEGDSIDRWLREAL